MAGCGTAWVQTYCDWLPWPVLQVTTGQDSTVPDDARLGWQHHDEVTCPEIDDHHVWKAMPPGVFSSTDFALMPLPYSISPELFLDKYSTCNYITIHTCVQRYVSQWMCLLAVHGLVPWPDWRCPWHQAQGVHQTLPLPVSLPVGRGHREVRYEGLIAHGSALSLLLAFSDYKGSIVMRHTINPTRASYKFFKQSPYDTNLGFNTVCCSAHVTSTFSLPLLEVTSVVASSLCGVCCNFSATSLHSG